MKAIALQATGYTFLVLGVLGLFLPFLQGFLFIAIGLLILARHAVWAHNLLQRFRNTHPRSAELIDRAEITMGNSWQRTETTVAGCWHWVLRCVRRSG